MLTMQPVSKLQYRRPVPEMRALATIAVVTRLLEAQPTDATSLILRPEDGAFAELRRVTTEAPSRLEL
jgi:hypothetical protein